MVDAQLHALYAFTTDLIDHAASNRHCGVELDLDIIDACSWFEFECGRLLGIKRRTHRELEMERVISRRHIVKPKYAAIRRGCIREVIHEGGCVLLDFIGPTKLQFYACRLGLIFAGDDSTTDTSCSLQLDGRVIGENPNLLEACRTPAPRHGP